MRSWSGEELKELLDAAVERYNVPGFIKDDPVSIPRRFSRKEDIEISAFITATLSWGQRPVILSNASRFMALMDDQPFDFIMQASPAELKRLRTFVHRTFNGTDAVYFVKALRSVYRDHGGLEPAFTKALRQNNGDMGMAISVVRSVFFGKTPPGRTARHFSNPQQNSAAKRINMMLRWLVRRDKKGVDFGIWKSISPSLLFCPLDVHSGNVAREFGLLTRKQNDWKAVAELTSTLRAFDPSDPVKYDFALFGIGVNQGK